jgi:hypothetical protein
MKLLIVIFTILVIQGCGGSSKNSDQSATGTIKATLNVSSIPISFVYDLDSNPSNSSEYQWEIAFDINNDSIVNEGDIAFRISLNSNTDTNTSQSIIERSELKAYIWEYGDGESYVSIREAEIDLLSTDESFTFIASLDLHESLNLISSGTQILASTIYRDQISGIYYYDYYPNKDTYTSGLDTTMLMDETYDFWTNVGPVNDANYPLIDIESVSIEIE